MHAVKNKKSGLVPAYPNLYFDSNRVKLVLCVYLMYLLYIEVI